MVALLSSETLVLTRATRRNIPEDGILHSHRRENLKSCIKFQLFQQGSRLRKEVSCDLECVDIRLFYSSSASFHYNVTSKHMLHIFSSLLMCIIIVNSEVLVMTYYSSSTDTYRRVWSRGRVLDSTGSS
jgi:hypothetical protein